MMIRLNLYSVDCGCRRDTYRKVIAISKILDTVYVTYTHRGMAWPHKHISVEVCSDTSLVALDRSQLTSSMAAFSGLEIGASLIRRHYLDLTAASLLESDE